MTLISTADSKHAACPTTQLTIQRKGEPKIQRKGEPKPLLLATMASRKHAAGRARRVGLQGHKWVSTRLSENARLLTATAASPELDPSDLPASGREDFDITNNEDASLQESVDAANLSTPHLSSDDDSDTDDVPEHERAPVNNSTTVAEELEMHLGSNNAQVNSDDDGSKVASEIFPRRIYFIVSGELVKAFDTAVCSWRGPHAVHVLCITSVMIACTQVSSATFACAPCLVARVAIFLVLSMVTQQLEVCNEAM